MPWFVLHVQTGHEPQTAQHLDRRGVEQYLPTYSVERRRSHACHRKTETVLKARFQGYLFARFINDEQRYVALCSPGVYELVHFGGEVAQLADFELELIRQMVASNEFPAVREPEVFKAGYIVQVSDGLLCGYTGVVKAQNKRWVLVELLNALSGSVRKFELDPAYLKILKKDT